MTADSKPWDQKQAQKQAESDNGRLVKFSESKLYDAGEIDRASDIGVQRRCRNCGDIFSTSDRRRTLCSRRCARESYLSHARNRTSKQREAEPAKDLCRQTLKNAVLLGKVRRPVRCEQCAKPAKVQAHHEDYSRPFFVEWLCRKCHGLADARRRHTEQSVSPDLSPST